MRERKEGGILGRAYVHANTLSMMGCSRAKEMYWLLSRVQIRVVIEVGSSRIFFKSRCGRKCWADAPTRCRCRFMASQCRWGSQDSQGGERSCRWRRPCETSHGVTPFCGNDTASGAYRSDNRCRLSRGSPKVAAVAIAHIAPLDHVCLEGQRPSDTMKFLPSKKTRVSIITNQY